MVKRRPGSQPASILTVTAPRMEVMVYMVRDLKLQVQGRVALFQRQKVSKNSEPAHAPR